MNGRHVVWKVELPKSIYSEFCTSGQKQAIIGKNNHHTFAVLNCVGYTH